MRLLFQSTSLFTLLSVLTIAFMPLVNADAEESCLVAPVRLSEKMSTRLKEQTGSLILARELSDSFFSLFSDERYDEAKEVADALVLISSCENRSAPFDHANILTNAAMIHDKVGDLDGAEQLFASASAIFDLQPGTDNIDVVRGLGNYAVFLAKRGKRGVALTWFRKTEEHASPMLWESIQQLKSKSLGDKPKTEDLSPPQNVLKDPPEDVQKYTTKTQSTLQPACLVAPIKLSEKMAILLNSQTNPQDTYKKLSGEFTKHFSTGRYWEAKEIIDAMVVLSSCLHKLDALGHAYVLANAAMVHERSGDLEGARQLFADAATIFDKQPEGNNPYVVRGLTDYAVFLAETGKRDDAFIWFLKAKERAPLQFRDTLKLIMDEKLGVNNKLSESSQGAKFQHLMIKIQNLKSEHRYAETVPIADEALEIAGRIYDGNPRMLAFIEMRLAPYFEVTGNYEKGENIYSHALGLLAQLGADGASQLDKAKMFFASNYLKSRSGKLAEAEKIYREVAESRRKRGDPPISLAAPLGNLAGLRLLLGFPEEAEQLYKDSLAAAASGPLGKNNQGYANGLGGLASFYEDSARLEEALKITQESISVLEKVTGSDGFLHSSEATNPFDMAKAEYVTNSVNFSLTVAISNLAHLYAIKEEYVKAEELYKKALKMGWEYWGDDQALTPIRVGLAGLLIKIGRYDEARDLLNQSQKMFNQANIAKDSIHRLGSIIRFGELDMASGHNDSAAEYFYQGLEILKKQFSSQPPKTLANLFTLMGVNRIKMKQQSAGINILISAMEEHLKVRDSIIYTLNDRQKLNYIAANTGSVAALLSSLPGGNDRDISKTFDFWLRWKGGLYENQLQYFSLSNQSGDSATTELFGRLKDVSRQLASLYLHRNNDDSTARRLSSLEKEKEDIETRLSKLSRQFSRMKRAATMNGADIASLLGKSSAYIDLAKLPSYDFNTMKLGPDQYYAFVSNNQQIVFVSLGEAEQIDSLVRSFQAEIRRAAANGAVPREGKLRQLSRSIYASVITPLKVYLPPGGNLYISPDGDLNLIPFEILEDTEGSQVLDHYTVSYATTGPDLIRSVSAEVSVSKEATLIADPDFDGGTTAVSQQSTTTASRDLRSLHFSKLPETAIEIRTISEILTKSGLTSQTLTGQGANDESLYALNAPRVLHIATHGFFLKSLSGHPKTGQSLDSVNTLPTESPHVRSGLALAGANLSLKQGGDTGLATVGKLMGLRLAGTDMVILSACNTGIGDIEAGEGVFGLKRAIALAGARSVITSLWSVPSDETVQLMTTFYGLWTAGKTKAQALQEAKLSMRAKQSNLFYWGAFTLSGARE